MSLVERVLAGDERAVSRALTVVETGGEPASGLLAPLRAAGRRARVVGVTGSPGAGKSSLVDRLVARCRELGERVAVVAVDPSSPFTGGAILGDRIRMGRHHADRGVFVRSMAARGALGGLARATVGAVSVLEAAGFDRVLIETVGVGQSEVDIARVADHCLLVVTPAGGDGVQAFKAGIMEIADVFAVNKADLPGAERTRRELQAALEFGPHDASTWWPPIVLTVASDDTGTIELLEALERHREHLGADGLAARRLERARFEVAAVVTDAVRALVERAGPELLEDVAHGRTTAEAVARSVLGDGG